MLYYYIDINRECSQRNEHDDKTPSNNEGYFDIGVPCKVYTILTRVVDLDMSVVTMFIWNKFRYNFDGY